MKKSIISLILFSNILLSNSTGMSAKSAKSAKSGKSAKSPKSYQTSTATITTTALETTSSTTLETSTAEECCDLNTTTQQPLISQNNEQTILSTLGIPTSSTITNILPTIIVPSSSTIPITSSSLHTSQASEINSSILGLNDNNSSQKMSAALISVISFSVFIILAIFIITLLRRKKQQRNTPIIENQHYIGNASYEEPIPIIEQVIDSYYGTVEEGILYENAEDEEGYLYALPQSDCDQTIFDESYEKAPINKNQSQEQVISSNLYDTATQEDILYDLGNNNYTYNEFC